MFKTVIFLINLLKMFKYIDFFMYRVSNCTVLNLQYNKTFDWTFYIYNF